MRARTVVLCAVCWLAAGGGVLCAGALAAADAEAPAPEVTRAELATLRLKVERLERLVAELTERVEALEAAGDTGTQTDAETPQKAGKDTPARLLAVWRLARDAAHGHYGSHWDPVPVPPSPPLVRRARDGSYVCKIPLVGRRETTGGRWIGYQSKRAVATVVVTAGPEGLRVQSQEVVEVMPE